MIMIKRVMTADCYQHCLQCYIDNDKAMATLSNTKQNDNDSRKVRRRKEEKEVCGS